MPRVRPAAGLVALALLHLGAPAPASAAPANVLACGASGSDVFTTTSSTFVPVRTCSVTAPQDGTLVVVATASAGLDAPGASGAYELQGRLGVDAPAGSAATDRYVDVTPDGADGTDRALADTTAVPVPAGRHTVTLGVRRSSGNGTVRLYSPQLTAVFVPGDSAQAAVCSDGDDDQWTTASAALQTVRSCRLTLPVASDVLLLAGASAGATAGGGYELRTRLAADGATAIAGSERRLDLADQPSGGADAAAFSSALVGLDAGTHELTLLASRSAGSGTVALDDPQLTAVAIPRTGSRLTACGTGGLGTFSTTAGALAPVRSCDATAAVAGSALIVGSASAALGTGGASELRARLGVDNPTGTAATDRWVDVYPDGGDGTDATLALSAFSSVTAGPHTFSLSAHRYAGAGAIRLDGANVGAIIVPPPDLTAPGVSFTEQPAAVTTDTSAGLAFASDDPHAALACRLDGAPPAPCTSPVRLGPLALGSHTFSVQGTDAVGNVGTPATASWRVDAPQPPAAPAPPPAPAPVVLTMAPSRSPARARVVSARYERTTGRIVLRVALGGAGRVTATASARLGTRTRTIGTRSGRASRERTVTLVLHASKAARSRTRLSTRIRVVVQPVVGARQTLSKTLVLRRPARKR
jgi:hypothetical protein